MATSVLLLASIFVAVGALFDRGGIQASVLDYVLITYHWHINLQNITLSRCGCHVIVRIWCRFLPPARLLSRSCNLGGSTHIARLYFHSFSDKCCARKGSKNGASIIDLLTIRQLFTHLRLSERLNLFIRASGDRLLPLARRISLKL